MVWFGFLVTYSHLEPHSVADAILGHLSLRPVPTGALFGLLYKRYTRFYLLKIYNE